MKLTSVYSKLDISRINHRGDFDFTIINRIDIILMRNISLPIMSARHEFIGDYGLN